MQVHVICCNDSVEFAVVADDEKAKKKMGELRALHFERNKGAFKDEKEYLARCYWHIHTVDGEA